MITKDCKQWKYNFLTILLQSTIVCALEVPYSFLKRLISFFLSCICLCMVYGLCTHVLVPTETSGVGT